MDNTRLALGGITIVAIGIGMTSVSNGIVAFGLGLVLLAIARSITSHS